MLRRGIADPKLYLCSQLPCCHSKKSSWISSQTNSRWMCSLPQILANIWHLPLIGIFMFILPVTGEVEYLFILLLPAWILWIVCSDILYIFLTLLCKQPYEGYYPHFTDKVKNSQCGSCKLHSTVKQWEEFSLGTHFLAMLLQIIEPLFATMATSAWWNMNILQGYNEDKMR